MNNNLVVKQTQILIDVISKHYQYYNQQSIERHEQGKSLSLEFYQCFIDNLSIELEHINFDFPVTANLGYCVEPEQVSRWALYWQLEFKPQLDINGSFSCIIQLMSTNQQAPDFKLICDNGASLYSKITTKPVLKPVLKSVC